MKIGFIGAGKTGFSLGKYFCERGLNVAGYYSRSLESAEQAAEFTGTRCFDDIESIVRECDLLFLTVPDRAIKEVWGEIRDLPLSGKIICHCSGSLSSEVFDGIAQTGARGFSLHPLMTMNDKLNSYKSLYDAHFTLDGAAGVLEIIKPLGNPIHIISARDKPLYHCAAVFVSNFTVALAQTGIDLLKRSGCENCSEALLNLMSASVRNIVKQGPANALTGPVERNDAETIKSHLPCLNDSEKRLYALLSEKLIEIAKIKNPDIDYDELSILIKDVKDL